MDPLVIVVMGIVFWAIVLFPTVKILHRMGFSGWWSPLILTGFGMVVALWVLAYVRWPATNNLS
jgi:hypothetical protein